MLSLDPSLGNHWSAPRVASSIWELIESMKNNAKFTDIQAVSKYADHIFHSASVEVD